MQIRFNEKGSGQRWRLLWKQKDSKNDEGKFAFCLSIIISKDVYDLKKERLEVEI